MRAWMDKATQMKSTEKGLYMEVLEGVVFNIGQLMSEIKLKKKQSHITNHIG